MKILAASALAAAFVSFAPAPAAPPPTSTVSVRTVVPGGLYTVRGSTTGDAVTVQVRRASAATGFPTISSGQLMLEDTNTGSVEISFSPSGTGARYLIVAIPQEAGVQVPGRASFTEIVY